MAIFPNLEIEDTVQVNDKTRLSGIKSFVDKSETSAITLIEIEPEAASGFVDVTGSSSQTYFLDWQYSGATRTVTVSCRVTTDGAPVTFTKTLEVIDVADDRLFSGDQELTAKEHDILSWVPAGRNSFLNVHRKAQQMIMDWFDQSGYCDTSGDRLTKVDVVDLEEVRAWATNLALQLIFEDVSTTIDDKQKAKSLFYQSEVADAKHRLKYRLDLNNDGIIDTSEGVRIKSTRMLRV